MATAIKLAPAAGRKWLTLILGGFLILIGVGLVYRQISGSTAADQRAANKREKESRELASKTPGSAEAFSARLEAKRLQAEEEAAKEAAKRAGDTPVAPAPTAQATVAKIREAAPKPLPTGLMPPGRPGDASNEQLDAYEALRTQQVLDTARQMGAWESSDRLRTGQGRSDSATSVQANAGDVAEGRGSAVAPGSTAAALIAAYQRSQAASDSGASLGRDASFMKQTGERQEQSALVARAGLGRFALLEGSSIDVVMRTNVSSDIGGPCRAQVSRNVFDSVTQQDLLIPAGAQVICTYNSEVVQGQERLLLAFTRLVYPNGASVQLGAMPGADALGAIGAPAEVNSRFWKTFGSSFLIAAVARLAQTNTASNITVNVGGSGGTGGVAASVLADVAKKSLERNTNIKPDLRINAGDRLSLVVARDMVLDPTVTGVGQ